MNTMAGSGPDQTWQFLFARVVVLLGFELIVDISLARCPRQRPHPFARYLPSSRTMSNNNDDDNQSSSTTQLIIPASAPAGEIIFTKPLPTVTSYYKIAQDNLITFGWNFSYVLATPTHLTVSAACSGGNTYPVGPTDGVIDGTATEVVWDIYSYQVNNRGTPLPQAVCNLMICDERGYGAARRGGYLSPNQNLQFALYTPQAYTPLASGESCP
jgi:hypothetical protein